MSRINQWVWLSLLCVSAFASVACSNAEAYDRAEVELHILPSGKQVLPVQTIAVTDAKVIKQLADHFGRRQSESVNGYGSWLAHVRVTLTNQAGSRVITSDFKHWNDKGPSDMFVEDQKGLEELILSMAMVQMRNQPVREGTVPAATPTPE